MSASTDISCVSMTVNKKLFISTVQIIWTLNFFFREIVPVRIRILGKHVISKIIVSVIFCLLAPCQLLGWDYNYTAGSILKKT